MLNIKRSLEITKIGTISLLNNICVGTMIIILHAITCNQYWMSCPLQFYRYLALFIQAFQTNKPMLNYVDDMAVPRKCQFVVWYGMYGNTIQMTSTYLRCYVVWQRWDASQQWLLQCGVLAAGRNPSSIHRQIKESPRQLTWTRTPHQRAATSPRHNPSERLPSLGLKWCCHTNIYGRCPVWRWCALDEVIILSRCVAWVPSARFVRHRHMHAAHRRLHQGCVRYCRAYWLINPPLATTRAA